MMNKRTALKWLIGILLVLSSPIIWGITFNFIHGNWQRHLFVQELTKSLPKNSEIVYSMYDVEEPGSCCCYHSYGAIVSTGLNRMDFIKKWQNEKYSFDYNISFALIWEEGDSIVGIWDGMIHKSENRGWITWPSATSVANELLEKSRNDFSKDGFTYLIYFDVTEVDQFYCFF